MLNFKRNRLLFNTSPSRIGVYSALFVFFILSIVAMIPRQVFAASPPLSPGCYNEYTDNNFTNYVDPPSATLLICPSPFQIIDVQDNNKCFLITGVSGGQGTRRYDKEISCATGEIIANTDSSTSPFSSFSDSEYEKKLRYLIYSVGCMDTFTEGRGWDFDDELDNRVDILQNEDDLKQDFLAVGFDLDKDNAMQTCETVFKEGLNILNLYEGGDGKIIRNSNDIYDYLVERITGVSPNWSSGTPIQNQNSAWETGKETLSNSFVAAIQGMYAQRSSNFPSFRRRFVAAVDMCYDRYSNVEGSLKSSPRATNPSWGDFELNNGVFLIKDGNSNGDRGRRSDIIGNRDGKTATKAAFIRVGDPGFQAIGDGNSKLWIGDFPLDYFLGADLDDEAGTFKDNIFYPIGIDYSLFALTSGGSLDNSLLTRDAGVVSCAWLKSNANRVLEGISIDENGEWVGLTDDEEAYINDPSVSGDGRTGDSSNSCESEGGVLSWVTCSFITLTSNGIDWVEKQIQGYLVIDSSFVKDSELKSAWMNIRNISYLLLIPIMLVMVISTALGMDFISAYTVKRALPRMIAAVMFITLSWYICAFLIDFFNAIGAGVRGLMEAPFANAVVGQSGDGTNVLRGVDGKLTLATLFTGGSIATAFESLAFGVTIGIGAIALIFFFLPTFLLSIAIGWLVLTMRQLLIVGLVMLSPLAILAWIFPGNDKLWKLWWNSFTKLLMMYPLIMMLIAAGHIMAFLISTDGSGGALNFILRTGMWCVPYLFIPATFKFAGGALATIAGVANDKSKGLFDRARNKRGQKFKDFKTGNFNGELGKRLPGFNRLGAGLGAGFSGRYGFGKRGRASMSQRSATAALDNAKNNAQLQQFAATDDDGSAVLALSGGTDAGAERAAELIKQRRIAAGMDEAEATAKSQRALAAARAVGVSRANAQSALTLMAQNKSRAVGAGDMDMVQEGINALAGGNSQLATDLKKNFQYHSRQAGRYDLGGDDPVSGAAKASLYQLANGHRSSIEALGTHHATAAAASGNYEDAAILDHELAAMLPNATGDVADEIHKQRAALRADGGLEAFLSTPTGKTKQVRVDWDGSDPSWSPTEQARGWRTETRGETMADVTKSRARVYQQPDPHNIP